MRKAKPSADGLGPRLAPNSCEEMVASKENICQLADCCAPEEAFHSVELQGAEEHELERVHVQLPSSSHIFPHTPVLPDPPILLLLPLPHAIPGVTAGGEPGWSWTTARRPHRGPRGGDPAREAALEAGPGSPAPRPARPTPQCAVHWKWGGGVPVGGQEWAGRGVSSWGVVLSWREKVYRRSDTLWMPVYSRWTSI